MSRIVERLPLNALFKMMKNLGFSRERLIYDKIFDQAVLLSGPEKGHGLKRPKLISNDGKRGRIPPSQTSVRCTTDDLI